MCIRDSHEHEQGERVRSWLQKNALGLIGGIALGFALIYGWHWWKGQQASQREGIATQYDCLLYTSRCV